MGGESAVFAALPGRRVLAIAGQEAPAFLQALVSNDVDKVGPGRAIYAALLTPQGKFLHDFFIAGLASRLVLDCDAVRAGDLLRRLRTYRLRARVEIADAGPGLAVFALFGPRALARAGLAPEEGMARTRDGGVVFADPRLAAAGGRAILPPSDARRILSALGLEETGPEAYERLRLALGLPDGARDLAVEKSTLVEAGFEEMNGVDFAKGCYVGQEVTARTKHRGRPRRGLYRVIGEGPLPPPGTPILRAGRAVGEMRSSLEGTGLALVRRQEAEAVLALDEALLAGTTPVRLARPAWARA